MPNIAIPAGLRRAAMLSALIVAMSTALAWARGAVLPSYLAFPAGSIKPNGDGAAFEQYGEATFRERPDADEVIERGKHWSVVFAVLGIKEDADPAEVWSRLKGQFEALGWVVETENPGPSATLQLKKNGVEAWANLYVFSATDVRMDVVELGGQPRKLTLVAPAATAEKIADDKGDFPYLKPLPGSAPHGGSRSDAPMLVASRLR